MKKVISRLKGNARNKITNIKNGAQKFKENFSEAKSKPRSKRDSFLLGGTTVICIFGLILLVPVLSAAAKDGPTKIPTPGPGEVCPAPLPPQPPFVGTQPPVVGTQPPFVGTQPPVVGTQPPVVGTQPPVVSSPQTIGGSSGAVSTLVALAASSGSFVSSGSFMIGAVCGVIVVIGISIGIVKAQGK
jgi:hypothetical protein